MFGVKNKTKADRVFDALKKGGKGGVTNAQLNKISFRYGAIIFNLRKDGYNIRTEKIGNNGLYKFYMEQ